jgi:hypothetical protein
MADREKIRTMRSAQKILDRGTFEDRCKVHPLQADPSECVSEKSWPKLLCGVRTQKMTEDYPRFTRFRPVRLHLRAPITSLYQIATKL